MIASYTKDVGRKWLAGFFIFSGLTIAYVVHPQRIDSFFTGKEISNLEKKSCCFEKLFQEGKYIVKKKDTGYKISKNLEISLEELRKYNPNKDLDKIFPGDTLWLKEKEF